MHVKNKNGGMEGLIVDQDGQDITAILLSNHLFITIPNPQP